MLSSKGSSRPRNWTGVSCIAGRFFTSWATREALTQHNTLQIIEQFLNNKILEMEERLEDIWG